jgi:hypothetical protein
MQKHPKPFPLTNISYQTARKLSRAPQKRTAKFGRHNTLYRKNNQKGEVSPSLQPRCAWLMLPPLRDKTMRCMVLWAHPKRPWMDALLKRIRIADARVRPGPESRNRRLRIGGSPRNAPFSQDRAIRRL